MQKWTPAKKIICPSGFMGVVFRVQSMATGERLFPTDRSVIGQQQCRKHDAIQHDEEHVFVVLTYIVGNM